MREVVELSSAKLADLVGEYSKYKRHVCRQEYAGVDGSRSKKNEAEKVWLADHDAADLVTVPRCLNRGRAAFLGGRAASSIVEPSCSPEPLTA